MSAAIWRVFRIEAIAVCRSQRKPPKRLKMTVAGDGFNAYLIGERIASAVSPTWHVCSH
jgi:hypothetical protein